MTKEIAKKAKNLYSDVKPDHIKDSERGQENVSIEDVTIPRLGIIQSLSPQRKKNDPAYIPGAEEGMMFNTVTGNLYSESTVFIPCYFKKEWLIWKKQSNGGGFEGSFHSEQEAATFFSEMKFNEDYEIVDTGNHFGLIVDGETIEEIVVSMSKSKMKVSRQLNTIVKMRGGDRFSTAYSITVVEDQNKEGQSYFNFKISPLGYTPEDLFKAGEKLYTVIAAGEKGVSYAGEESTAEETEY